MSSRVQNLLMILGIVLIAGIGFYLYTQRSNTDLSTGSVDNELAASTGEFVQRLVQLNSITFDSAVFSDTRFRSLVDFSEPINPQPVGRPNPFVSN